MDGTIMATPLGRFTVVVDGDDVVASGWAAGVDHLVVRNLSLAGVRMRRDLGPVSRAVRDYFLGDVDAPDAIPVRQSQGGFLDRAYAALRTVRAGTLVSYGDLAVLAGNPGAARAAGTACARNNVPLFVPCHRVVRGDGSVGEFGFGPGTKQWLIDHERGAAAPRPGPAGRRPTIQR